MAKADTNPITLIDPSHLVCIARAGQHAIAFRRFGVSTIDPLSQSSSGPRLERACKS